MADDAVAHAGDVRAVPLVVGAAHRPGIVEYLERRRDGDRGVEWFESVTRLLGGQHVRGI